ncbi:MAG: hypothetical protein NZ777_04075 [Pseudomonadales bacterium]|nr:hypothetical protein [Pseudomonadales bacterium]
MKRLLIVLLLLLAGCGETGQLIDGIADQPSWKGITDEVNSSGTITDDPAESLSKMKFLDISEACQKLIDIYKKSGHGSSAPIVDLDERRVVSRPSLKHGGVA